MELRRLIELSDLRSLRSFHADYLEEQRLLLYFGEEDGVLCLSRDRFLSRSRRLQLSAD